MEEALRLVIPAILGAFGGAGAVVILLFLFPEKVEKWWSLFWLLLAKRVPQLVRFAHRRYVQHDFQSRVNEFTKELSRQAPYLETEKVLLDWADEGVTRESFFRDDKVILRLRRDDPHDENFVHAALLFVSESLLMRAKRYVSRSHRESVDLYVTSKMIEREKPHVLDIYLREYLHPQTADASSKVAGYIDAYEKMDRTGVFFPLFLQELQFLGNKVFGKRQDDRIIVEVNTLIDRLTRFAARKREEEIDLTLAGDYCRHAIVIVGKAHKLTEGADLWASYIRRYILPTAVETLYLVGLAHNVDIIDDVARQVSEQFDTYRARRDQVRMRYDDDRSQQRYLLILRRKGTTVVQPS